MTSLNNQMARGAAWMTGLMLVDRSIGMISTIILARLLVPADFGLVAMCTSIIAGLELFTAFGFDVVLIQKQDAGRSHYDTAWTYKVLSGGLVALLIVGAARPTASFYGEERVVWPMIFLGIGFFIRSLENIAVVDFRKHMQFKKETILRVSQKLIGFSITIPAALMLRSYWALIIGMLALSLSTLVLSYTMKPYMPRFTMKERRDIFGFSAWLFLTNLIIFVRLRFGDFVLGRLSGASSLGLFQISNDLSTTPATQLIASVNRAVYPGYARLADDREALLKTFFQVIAGIALIALPASVGMFAISDLVVPVVLGAKWAGASPLVAVLALYGAILALTSNSYYIFHAIGKPKYSTLNNAYQVLVLVPCMLMLVPRYGAIGAAWALLLQGVLSVPFLLIVLKLAVGIRLRNFVAVFWRPSLAVAVMDFLVHEYIKFDVFSGDILKLLGAILVGLVSYVLAMTIFVLLSNDGDSIEKRMYRSYVLPAVLRLGWFR